MRPPPAGRCPSIRAPRVGLSLAALAAGALAACPLPQPLPEVARVDGGTVTPPRIVVSTASPPDTRILVDRACPAPRFTLQAQVEDLDTTEQVEARWFVDYDPRTPGIIRADVIGGTGDETITVRPVPAFVYLVPAPDAANTAHVVEIVVSNGFAPSGDLSAPLPNRTPSPGFETQVFRWVFQYADAGGQCP